MGKAGKGKVTLLGDSVYKIEITYNKESHGRKCNWCSLLINRQSGTEIHGIAALAGALNVVMEYFTYDIVNSEMYSHCRNIQIAVMQDVAGEWTCIEEHEITKESTE